MVKKLIKHEFIAYLRTLLPMQLIVIGIAVLCRFIQLFENKELSYKIVFYSSVIALCIGVLVAIVMTMAYGITRFYKNLFTGEGYLSFTLPVTATEHIFAKLLMLIIATFITIFAILLSVCVATAGDVFVELVKAAVYLLKRFLQSRTAVHGIFIIIEFVTLVLIGIISQYILCYGCIAVGQLANKNRILAAFGTYFGYYLFTQIIGTIIVVISTVVIRFIDTSAIYNYIIRHPNLATHLFFGFFIVFYAVLSVIYFVVTKKIIEKRLNLE